MIEAGKKAGSEASGEKESPGNRMTGKNCGST